MLQPIRVYLSVDDLKRLMRKHNVTIRVLAIRLGVTIKRIRQVKQTGLCPYAARDWIQAVTGEDPGSLCVPVKSQAS